MSNAAQLHSYTVDVAPTAERALELAVARAYRPDHPSAMQVMPLDTESGARSTLWNADMPADVEHCLVAPYCDRAATHEIVEVKRLPVMNRDHLRELQEFDYYLMVLADKQLLGDISAAELVGYSPPPTPTVVEATGEPVLKYFLYNGYVAGPDGFDTIELASAAADKLMRKGEHKQISVRASLTAGGSSNLLVYTLPDAEDLYVDVRVTRTIPKPDAAPAGFFTLVPTR